MRNIVQEVQNKYSFLNNILKNFWKSWLRSNSTLKWQLQNIKWKNSKAKPGCAYKPTEVIIITTEFYRKHSKISNLQIEQLANVITHGIWIFPSIIATIKLYERSKTSGQFLVSWVYGGALTMLFTVSTFFHCTFYCSNQK